MAPTFAIGIGSDAPIRSSATANLEGKHLRRVYSPRAATISKQFLTKVFTAIAKVKVKARASASARAAMTIVAVLARSRAKVKARTKSTDTARVAVRLPNDAPGHDANQIGNHPGNTPKKEKDHTRPRLENPRLIVDRGITAPRKPRIQNPPRGGTSKRKTTTKKGLVRRDIYH